MGNKASQLLEDILKMMEERKLKQWEAEWVAKQLGKEIKENDERKRRNQPFTVFK